VPTDPMTAHALLEPGSWRSSAHVDDRAVLQAVLDVEVAWVEVQVSLGLVPAHDVDRVVGAVRTAGDATAYDLSDLARRSEDGGNPVLPVLADLRDHVGRIDPAAAALVHRGLTSQDVLDTALMLVARRTLEQLHASLSESADALAGLAERHRGTVMVGRTLTQHALPTTFGLKAAGWLSGVLDGLDAVDGCRAALPVQCGGAVGTLAAVHALVPGRALDAADLLSGALGLATALPWHTNRTPVTRLADTLVTVADALGKIGADVCVLSRPEIGELAEPSADGRGISSTLPQKRNPVLSVLIRSVAIEAPHLAAQVHSAAALAVDERPDGSWHAEWPALIRLLGRVAAAASQAAELLASLEVDAAAMQATVVAAGPSLLAERILAAVGRARADAEATARVRAALRPGRSPAELVDLLREVVPDAEGDIADWLDPAAYLGVGDALIDRVLARRAGGSS